MEAALGVVWVGFWVSLSENQNIIREFADKELKKKEEEVKDLKYCLVFNSTDWENPKVN